MSTPGLDQVLNYLPISDDLPALAGRPGGTAGQPTREQFAEIAAAGYQVVINLAMPTSTGALPDESELVEEQGMEYLHIPVVWEAPTREDLDRFFAAMDRYRDRKVFVHCALNMRVSVFYFLYRVLRLGVPPAEAWDAVMAIWQPDGVWRALIEDSLGGSFPVGGDNHAARGGSQ